MRGQWSQGFMRGRVGCGILMACSGMRGTFWITVLLGMTVSCTRKKDLVRMLGGLVGVRLRRGKIGWGVFKGWGGELFAMK